MNEIMVSFMQILSLQHVIFMVIGLVVGLIAGTLPGINLTLTLALMIPFTFTLPPEASILMLIGVYCAGTYAGSVGAVLLKTPGTAASAATAQDGFALSQQGKAGTALSMSLYASVAGGLISGLILLFAAPQVAKFALNFGPPEYFALALFGLTIIASVSGNSLSKALVMAFLGMLVASVGMDPVTGTSRMTFNLPALLSGIDIIPALIGLFAISEILNQIEKGMKQISSSAEVDKEKFRWRDIFPFKKTILKSSIIGSIIGAIPGTGGAIASFISYNESRRTSKKPEEYGKGSMEGIAASESANNGTTGATLIPMLTLGVPGDVMTAVLLSSLLIQGIQPGPQLFESNGSLVYTIILGFLLVNILLFIFVKLTIKYFAYITLIPSSVLFPVVLVLCLFGAFAFSNSMTTVWFAIIFGVIGYILPKFGYPTIPFLIAMILGPMAESAFRQSLVMSGDSLLIFVERPFTVVFLVLAVVSIVLPLLQRSKHDVKDKN